MCCFYENNVLFIYYNMSVGISGFGGKQPTTSAYVKQYVSSANNSSAVQWIYTDNTLNTIEPSDANSISNTGITNNSAPNVYIEKNLIVGGNIITPSDERVKNNIEPLLHSSDMCDKLMNLRPKKFSYRSDTQNKSHYGFIAQELEEQFPELVSDIETRENVKTKAIQYLELIPILLLKIQDLQKQIDDVKNKNKKNHNTK